MTTQLALELTTDGEYIEVQSNGTEAQSNGVEQHEAQDGQQVEQEQEQPVENVFQLTIHLPHAPVRSPPTLQVRRF